MSGTVDEILLDMAAEHAARITYQRAIDRHFDMAERLAKSDPDAAERIADGAAELRLRAAIELRDEL